MYVCLFFSNLAVDTQRFFVTLINWCCFRTQLALSRLFLHIFIHSRVPLLLLRVKLLLVQVMIIVRGAALSTLEHGVRVDHASRHRGTHGTAVVVPTSMLALLSARLCVQRRGNLDVVGAVVGGAQGVQREVSCCTPSCRQNIYRV